RPIGGGTSAAARAPHPGARAASFREASVLRRRHGRPAPRGSPMRRAVSVSLLLLSVAVQQACQRDEATGPQRFQPSAQVLSGSASASRIAFTRGFGDIYVMNADGSEPVRLTDSPFLDGQASWSPDGRRIAFMSERDAIGVEEPQNIYVMNAD